jgi:hypothetical protein
MAKRAVWRDHDGDVHDRAATATLERPAGTNVRDHLLSLQRDYGNTAVTTIVQRKGSQAASTDAPGAKKKKGPAAKQEEDFAPKSTRHNGTADQLRAVAYDYWQGTNGKSMDLQKAAEYLEDAWLLTDNDGQARLMAMNIARIWKDWSEPKRYAFWMKVHTGEIKPKQEDMSDKGD